MRLPLCMVAVALLVGLSAGLLWADVAPLPWPRPRPPRPPIPQMAAVPPPNAAHITVDVSKTATQPILVIPRPLLSQVKLSGTSRQQETGGFIPPQLNLLLFALALAGGGLCLLRGRTRMAFASVLLLAVGATLGINRATLANAPPPLLGIPRMQVGDVLLENVRIEITPEQGKLRLTIPASALPRVR